MPHLTTSITTTEKPVVTLKPRVRAQLLTELRHYADLHQQKKALEAAMDQAKTTIGALREATGETSLSLEGYTITQVAAVRAKLNVKKLIAQGVTVAQIEMATETIPSKPYERITLPGGRDDQGRED